MLCIQTLIFIDLIIYSIYSESREITSLHFYVWDTTVISENVPWLQRLDVIIKQKVQSQAKIYFKNITEIRYFSNLVQSYYNEIPYI